MTRTNAREIALGCIFECLASGAPADEVLKRRLDCPGPADLAGEYALYAEEPDDDARAFIAQVTRAAEQRRDEFLSAVFAYAEGWRPERLSLMTRSILLLCVTEIVCTDVPTAVSINEAVELAKAYDEEKAPSFINGILGRFVRDREAAQKAAEETAGQT
ncbi:MAG: transcription antitermination factor NusB [Oscillospiraceae bacterium]|nr:transcription antitermination factor NusB [Oscillospiraceae bacterium]